MKLYIIPFIIGCLFCNNGLTQTFWVEDFGSGTSCNDTQFATIYSGTNGNWTMSQTGNNGVNSNEWYISAASSNAGAGTCDLFCPSGNNNTLHIANVSGSPAAPLFCPNGDCSAAYDDSDISTETSKRIESPIINLTGINSAQMSFIYMMKGQAGYDFGRVWFYDGTNWVSDTIPPQTSGCSFYKTWTYIVVDLPAFANNNPNFKVGFEWKNNGDAIANDPSLSIDNITIAQSFNSVNEQTNRFPFTYVVSENLVNFTFPENSKCKIELYDLTGKLISSDYKSFIELGNNGIYLINVWVDDERYSVKVSSN